MHVLCCFSWMSRLRLLKCFAHPDPNFYKGGGSEVRYSGSIFDLWELWFRNSAMYLKSQTHCVLTKFGSVLSHAFLRINPDKVIIWKKTVGKNNVESRSRHSGPAPKVRQRLGPTLNLNRSSTEYYRAVKSSTRTSLLID